LREVGIVIFGYDAKITVMTGENFMTVYAVERFHFAELGRLYFLFPRAGDKNGSEM
jgi:hypothetical protein